MNRPFPFLLAMTLPVVAQAQPAASPSALSNFQDRPGIFTVTTDVVNESVKPFTVTVPGFGNSLKRPGKGGFEPLSFRSQFSAAQDSADRVYISDLGDLDRYDSFASGYLDGAGVRVYRVVDGRIMLVRSDHVIPGGCVLEKWHSVGSNELIVPTANTAVYRWDDWTRPGAKRWFTIFAVNADGEMSPPAAPVKLDFVKAAKNAKAENRILDFRRPRKSANLPVPGAPSKLAASVDGEGIVHFSWAPSDGEIVGYRIGYTDTDPAMHRGTYLQLSHEATSDKERIKEGDMIIVAKDMAPLRPEYLSNRLGGLDRAIRGWMPSGVPNDLCWDTASWRLAPHTPDTPVEDAGRTYLEMTLTPGQKEQVGLSGIPDISTSNQKFYPVPEKVEYTMEVWLKADRAAAPPVTFEYSGDARVGGFIKPFPMQVTTSWKKYTHTFMGAPSDQGHHAYMVLTCEGPATYSVDNFRVYRSDTPYLDYTSEEYERLRESGMSAIRTHHAIKSSQESYSMDQYTGPNGTVEGVEKGISLGGVLGTIRKAGMDPWLQIEFHMSPEEWLGFAEFMAAPYDPAEDTPESKPWAYKRFKQGHPAPWTDDFDRIYFELSNETWNSLFAPWVFTGMRDSVTGKNHDRGAVYGMFQDHVAGILRSSPYWTKDVDAKFTQVMGGWAIGTYNAEIAKATRTADFITVAAYNGGWDEGEGPPDLTPASFFKVLNFANQTTLPRSQKLLSQSVEWEKQTGRHFRLGTYEAGPGYALNGLNRAKVSKQQAQDQERVMKSKAAGVATLDSFLAMAGCDFEVQNFFTFGEGDRWTSHTEGYAGGRPHPSFLYLSLFNREGTGDMLRVSVDSAPTFDLPAFKRRAAIGGAPTVAVYATRRGDRVNVFVVSRRYPDFPVGSGDGYTPVGLRLPFTKASGVTLYRATGAVTDTNLDQDLVRIESLPIRPDAIKGDGRFVVGPDTGGDAKGMPPAEVFLYVFEGTNIGPGGRELSRGEIARLPATFNSQ